MEISINHNKIKKLKKKKTKIIIMKQKKLKTEK